MSTSGEDSRAWRWAVAGIVLVHICVTVAYSLSVPVFESPDEPGHFMYIQFLGKNHRLPVQKSPNPDIPNLVGHHPPLYYLLLSIPLGVMGGAEAEVNLPLNPNFVGRDGTERNTFLHEPPEKFPFSGGLRVIHILRLFSIAMSAGTVLLIYRTGREILPEFQALCAAGIAASIPQFSFISGMINNDNLAVLFSTAAIFFAVKILKDEGRHPLLYVALGAAAGLALVTKITTMFLVPLCLSVPILVPAGETRSRGKALLLTGLSLAVTGGWFFIRNLFLYHEVLGVSSTIGPYYAAGTSASAHPLSGPSLALMFRSFFAMFGWLSIPTYPLFYKVYLAVFAGSGLLASRLLFRKGPIQNDHVRKSIAILLAAIALMLISLALFGLRYTGHYQGRYAFPIIGPLCIIAAAGFPGRAGAGASLNKVGLPLLTVVLFLMNVVTLLRVVMPSF